jgi:hypothetical protein
MGTKRRQILDTKTFSKSAKANGHWYTKSYAPGNISGHDSGNLANSHESLLNLQ